MPESPLHNLREPITPPPVQPAGVAWAELDVTSNFSFLRGASHPDELVATAAAMGYRAIAITDRNSLAGIVRAHVAAKQAQLKLIIGARVTLSEGIDLLVWVQNRTGYANLCRLLTLGKSRVAKGEFQLSIDEFLDHSEGLIAAILPPLPPGGVNDSRARGEGACPDQSDPDNQNASDAASALTLTLSRGERGPEIARLRNALRDRLSLAVSLDYGEDNQTHLDQMRRLSRELAIPLVATNHVHYHDPSRRPLQDVLVCVREKCTIDTAGYKLFKNAERHLKEPAQMHRLFADCPEAVRRAVQIASRCTFTLDELKYEYPHELVPDGMTPLQYLSQLAWDGARERYPDGIPEKVHGLVERELKLIAQLKYETYFLTVYDAVQFARSRGILCQGRGSAANSAVCYCIGITSVDPAQIDLLFERFVSAARDEPPDIDVDFEHERREEVIQYIYKKYGRDRAGMCAEIISYRGRSAIRDVGKALGLSLDMVDAMSRKLGWWDRGVLNDKQVREAGLDPDDANVRRILALAQELLGFPRHLGQHVGGMVMTETPLCEMVPIENATMQDRTVVEWDKNDIDDAGLLKVDCLALGMLTCISKAFRLLEGVERHGGTETRRHGGAGGREGDCDGDQHLSRSCGVAAGDGIGEGGLCLDAGHAARREVRVDCTDAPGRDLDSVEYRRGLCAGVASGLPSLSSDGQRFAGGVDDAGGTRGRSETDPTQPSRVDAADGGGPDPARTDPESPTEVARASFRASVPSCLRASPSRYQLHTLPREDPLVYDMICDADTIGVFQIESRAQMSMLPRLRPRCFYDLVIEVAIVRPGPIQGNMVHPYLRRRCGEERVSYPSEALKNVLHKTLGVPLFQEQAMKVAMVGASFSAEEADQLRRAMAAWRRSDKLMHFRQRIIDGMLGNGYTQQFAEQCFEQIKGFGEYGFPESHSASFALLVYASAWIKCHHPAAFAAALINSQPMGFYAPAQIIRDAREHGVEVRPVDVNASGWDCSLEEAREEGTKARRHENRHEGARASRHEGESEAPSCLRASVPPCLPTDAPALRLGFRMLKGFKQADAELLIPARKRLGRFESVDQLHKASGLSKRNIQLLAEADAFGSIDRKRRVALWEGLEMTDQQMPLFGEEGRHEGTEARRANGEAVSPPCLRAFVPSCPSSDLLPPMPLGQEVMTDYATAGVSLKAHPLALLRQTLQQQKIITAAELIKTPAGKFVRVAGLVLIRQRPGTASGIVFVTLEDETGIVNLIVRPQVFEQYNAAARHSAMLQCDGYVERQGQVIHVMAKRLFDRSDMVRGYAFTSRDFH